MFNDLAKEIHANAVSHGFWNPAPSFAETLALCHSELSEALEEYRKGKDFTEVYYSDSKPEGIPSEMADCIIRILDWAAFAGVDLDGSSLVKINYNATRSYKHDGKKL